VASRLRPRVVYSIGSQRIESLTHGQRQVYRILKIIDNKTAPGGGGGGVGGLGRGGVGG
jgi:hypothetical protein